MKKLYDKNELSFLHLCGSRFTVPCSLSPIRSMK